MVLIILMYTLSVEGMNLDQQSLYMWTHCHLKVIHLAFLCLISRPSIIFINFTGIVIVYHQESYQNLSIVNFNVDTRVLKCYTNKNGCCKFAMGGGEGEWFFPNGSRVRILASGDSVYRNRDRSVVNLKWKIYYDAIPMGIFCCEIPSYPVQRACIGVYPENKGN